MKSAIVTAYIATLCLAATQIKIPSSSKLLSARVKNIYYLSPDLVVKHRNTSKAKIELILFVPAKDIMSFAHNTARDREVSIWLYLPEVKIEIFGKVTNINKSAIKFDCQHNPYRYLALVEGKTMDYKNIILSKNSDSKKLIDARLIYDRDRTTLDLIIHFWRYCFGITKAKADFSQELN